MDLGTGSVALLCLSNLAVLAVAISFFVFAARSRHETSQLLSVLRAQQQLQLASVSRKSSAERGEAGGGDWPLPERAASTASSAGRGRVCFAGGLPPLPKNVSISDEARALLEAGIQAASALGAASALEDAAHARQPQPLQYDAVSLRAGMRQQSLGQQSLGQLSPRVTDHHQQQQQRQQQQQQPLPLAEEGPPARTDPQLGESPREADQQQQSQAGEAPRQADLRRSRAGDASRPGDVRDPAVCKSGDVLFVAERGQGPSGTADASLLSPFAAALPKGGWPPAPSAASGRSSTGAATAAAAAAPAPAPAPAPAAGSPLANSPSASWGPERCEPLNPEEGGQQANRGELKHIKSLPETIRARSMNAKLGNLEMGPLIGCGSFGSVYKAKWGSSIVAVKIIRHDDKSVASRLDGLRESAVASCLNHPNILSTYKVLTSTSRAPNPLAACHTISPIAEDSAMPANGHAPPCLSLAHTVSGPLPSNVRTDPTLSTLSPSTSLRSELLPASHEYRCEHLSDTLETWLLTEFCDRGSLDQAVYAGAFFEGRNRESGRRNLVAIYLVLKDIAAGMEHLHSVGLLHSDLKSSNVLLDSSHRHGPREFTAKVADFGLSQLMETNAAHVSITHIGSVAYMPTELLQEGKMTPAVDVWSFGCIMLDLWVGRRVHGDAKSQQVYCRVLMGRHPTIPEGMPAGYRALLEACWAKDPEQRPSFSEIYAALRELYRAENGTGIEAALAEYTTDL